MSKQPPIGWLNTLRGIVARMRCLLFELSEESDPETISDCIVFTCIALIDLRDLLDDLPVGPVEGDAMTALGKAHRLADNAPYSRSETGWLMTREFQDYAASIDLRSLDGILRLLSNVPVSTGAFTGKQTPKSDRDTIGKRRNKPGDAALKIKAALDSLADERKWNVLETEIWKLAGVPHATYYDLLKKDQHVIDHKKRYDEKRLGRGPIRADDL